MEYLFCTKQDVKEFAIASANSTNYDSLIEDLIRLWTANTKAFCRRNFVYGEYQEDFSVIKVSKTMLIRVAEAPITIDELHPFEIKCNGETIDSSLYEVNKEKGLIKLQVYTLPAGEDNLTVTYTGGLCVVDSNEGDENIKVLDKHPVRTAVANQCAYALLRTVQSNQGQQSSNTGRSILNTTPASMGFLPEVSMVLANYRLTLTGR